MKLNNIRFFKSLLFFLFTFISFYSFAQHDSLILSNEMDLRSLNVEYSINDKRKQFKKYQNHKNKMEEGLLLPPDTMSDISEFRFGTNPKLYAWVPFSTPNTAATMDPKATKFQMTSFTLHYLKYINDKWAWYTGLDVDFGAYNFNINFAKSDYPFLLDNYHIKYQTLSSYFNIPIGLHRNIKVGKRSNIEISSALNLSINASGSGAINYYGNTADSMIVVFAARVGKINFITPGIQLNIGYAYETKRKNKWIIGLRGSANFIKSYTIDYFILNPDVSYYQGKIDMHPINLQIYWRYALTGKRKRYLKAIGY